MPDLWYVAHPDGTPVNPFDCNPGCDDQGCLVYRSEAACELACEHQRDLYEACEHCRPMPLSELPRIAGIAV